MHRIIFFKFLFQNHKIYHLEMLYTNFQWSGTIFNFYSKLSDVLVRTGVSTDPGRIVNAFMWLSNFYIAYNYSRIRSWGQFAPVHEFSNFNKWKTIRTLDLTLYSALSFPSALVHTWNYPPKHSLDRVHNDRLVLFLCHWQLTDTMGRHFVKKRSSSYFTRLA